MTNPIAQLNTSIDSLYARLHTGDAGTDGGYSEVPMGALPSRASAMYSDRTLLIMILKALKEGSMDDLRSMQKTIHARNEKKKLLREIRAHVGAEVDRMTNDEGEYDKGSFQALKLSDGRTLNEEQLVSEYKKLTGGQELKLENKTVVQDIDNAISTINDLGQEDTTELQLVMQRFKEHAELLSGVMKSFHGIAMSIIQKIGQI